MKEIRDALELSKRYSFEGKEVETIKDFKFILKTFQDLAEKVLAVGGKMPEKFNLKSSPRKEYYNRLLHNQAIDQCTLAFAKILAEKITYKALDFYKALLSEEDIYKILEDNKLDVTDDYGEASEALGKAIHSAQMEKLGGVR